MINIFRRICEGYIRNLDEKIVELDGEFEAYNHCLTENPSLREELIIEAKEISRRSYALIKRRDLLIRIGGIAHAN